MKKFLDDLWTILKRVVIATGPALLSLLFGMFMAFMDALRSMYENQQPFTWASLWTIGGGAAGAYFLTKIFHINNKDWIRAFMHIAEAVMTPREALEVAAQEVKPLRSVDKIEKSVLKGETK